MLAFHCDRHGHYNGDETFALCPDCGRTSRATAKWAVPQPRRKDAPRPSRRGMVGSSVLDLMSQTGVYIVRDGEGGIQYIGSAVVIGRRISDPNHVARAYIGGWEGATVEVEVYSREQDAREREDELIRLLQPKLNTRGITETTFRKRARLSRKAREFQRNAAR